MYGWLARQLDGGIWNEPLTSIILPCGTSTLHPMNRFGQSWVKNYPFTRAIDNFLQFPLNMDERKPLIDGLEFKNCKIDNFNAPVVVSFNSNHDSVAWKRLLLKWHAIATAIEWWCFRLKECSTFIIYSPFVKSNSLWSFHLAIERIHCAIHVCPFVHCNWVAMCIH